MELSQVSVSPVERAQEARYQELMAQAHIPGGSAQDRSRPCGMWRPIDDQWVALLSFSAAAWKCAVRDRWIGWDFHRQQIMTGSN